MNSSGNAAFSGYDELLSRIKNQVGESVIIAVAGPPGVGKFKLAVALANSLSSEKPEISAAIPMDGFHNVDAVLNDRGLRSRKGSPPTFDVNGFRHLLSRIKMNDEA